MSEKLKSVEVEHAQTANTQADYIRDKTSGTHVIFASVGTPTEAVMSYLAAQKIQFKVLLGSYKAQRETSFLIGIQYLEKLFASGLIQNEESILVTGNAQKTGVREAFLVFNELDETGNSPIVHLGFLDVLKDSEVESVDAWSFDPTQSLYFGIRPLAA